MNNLIVSIDDITLKKQFLIHLNTFEYVWRYGFFDRKCKKSFYHELLRYGTSIDIVEKSCKFLGKSIDQIIDDLNRDISSDWCIIPKVYYDCELIGVKESVSKSVCDNKLILNGEGLATLTFKTPEDAIIEVKTHNYSIGFYSNSANNIKFFVGDFYSVRVLERVGDQGKILRVFSDLV